jgi:hypothetical protein
MCSSICAWLGILVGIISAFEWWRASNVRVTDLPPSINAPRDPSMPSAPFNPNQTSMGGLRDAALNSGALNNRAALWAAAGVILTAASNLLAAKGL